MRFWFALFCVGCSLEGFAGGVVPIGAGGAGGTGVAAGGSGGGCAPCTCSTWAETNVTSPGPSLFPSLAWSGDAWGLAWEDLRDGNREIYFARVDDGGMKRSELRVTNDGADSLFPKLVWNGTRYAIAYEDHRTGHSDAYIAWIDATGLTVPLDLRVCNLSPGCDGTPRAPAIAWGGSSYLMVWEDYRDNSWELRRGQVTDAGEPANVDAPINVAAGNEFAPAMVFGAFEYAVAWQDDRDLDPEIYFARLDGTGAKIGAEARITNAIGDSRRPAIAWTGSGYGLAWTDARDGADHVYFARLTEGGVLQDTEISLGEGLSPSIVWDGAGYAVAWHDRANHIYFARLDADGVNLGTAVVAGGIGATAFPSLAWSGTRYAVAWEDNRDGDSNIFFATCLP